MNTHDCQCGTQVLLDKGAIERPRFFPRQLVTPDDLTLGQDYFREKMRRHNRYLHGWGVVCGARVQAPAQAQPYKVVIQKGYVLGPFGDEIVLDREICFDLRVRCLTATGGDVCSDVVDPTDLDRALDLRAAASAPVYVAVRYKEIPSRPVRVQPVSCGCDDSHCEFSRWRDGYEICVLEECPASHAGSPPSRDEFLKPRGILDCPVCPSEPWVVLAKVELDAQGMATRIDNCSCRRTVMTLAPFWTRCNEPVEVVTSPEAQPTNPR